MDNNNKGLYYTDLLGEYSVNIGDPVQFGEISADFVSETTPGNTVVFTNTLTSKDIVPDTDNLHDLGSPTHRYATAYIDTIDITESSQDRINLTDASGQITFGAPGTSIVLNVNPAASDSIYTIPDVGGTSNFVMTSGTQTITGTKMFASTIQIPNSVSLKFQFNGTGDGTFATFMTCPNPTGIREVRIPDSGTSIANDFILSRGSQTIISPKTFSSAVSITPISNQLVLGTTNTVTLNAAVPGTPRVYTIPDVGVDTSFAMLDATIQTFTGIRVFQTLIANSFLGERASAPVFGNRGGFYVDLSGVMILQNPANIYNFNDNSGNRFVYMNRSEGIATGGISFFAQKSLHSFSTAEIYNSGIAGTGIQIYGNSSIKLQLFNGVGTTDYITLDPTQLIQCTQRTKITDTTSSTSQTTGALIVSGGIGAAKDCFLKGVAVDTSGGTPTVINYFEETTHSSVFTGAFTSGTITLRVKRLNNAVRVSFPQIQATATATALLTMSTALPTRFRPATEQTFGIRGTTGGTIQMITARIFTTGVIRFERIDGTNFPSGSTCGTAATNFTYDLDL